MDAARYKAARGKMVSGPSWRCDQNGERPVRRRRRSFALDERTQWPLLHRDSGVGRVTVALSRYFAAHRRSRKKFVRKPTDRDS